MKSDSVWVCAVDLDNTLVQLMSVDRSDSVWTAIKEGRMPSADELPIETWADSPRETFATLPHMFMGGGGNSFTREIAEPLLRFDLGLTFILPMRIFLFDRKTEVHADRGYHTMPRFEGFKALAPEESPALKPNPYEKIPTNWGLPCPTKDATWRSMLAPSTARQSGTIHSFAEASSSAATWSRRWRRLASRSIGGSIAAGSCGQTRLVEVLQLA